MPGVTDEPATPRPRVLGETSSFFILFLSLPPSAKAVARRPRAPGATDERATPLLILLLRRRSGRTDELGELVEDDDLELEEVEEEGLGARLTRRLATSLTPPGWEGWPRRRGAPRERFRPPGPLGGISPPSSRLLATDTSRRPLATDRSRSRLW